MGKRDAKGSARKAAPLLDSASELGSLDFKLSQSEDELDLLASDAEDTAGEDQGGGESGDEGGSEQDGSESGDEEEAGSEDEDGEEVEDALLDYASELRQRGEGGAEPGSSGDEGERSEPAGCADAARG
jgi:hypothetical protein